MSIRSAVLAAAFVPLIASNAAAQLLSSPLSFTVSAGPAIPIGDTSDGLNTGYSIGGAADLRVPLIPIGARLEGTYASFGAKGLPNSSISSRGTDLGANINLVMWIPTAVPLPLIPTSPRARAIRALSSTRLRATPASLRSRTTGASTPAVAWTSGLD